MLTLISGQPGNGKTLRAMSMMRAEYERNKAANALPPDDEKHEALRDFYSNVNGANLEEGANPNAFPWVKLLPPSADWTKLPPGSFVMYDEAHSDGVTPGLERYGYLFPSTGKPGESDDPRIRSMSNSRHFGYDLVFITQWPSKVHHNVRQLIGNHVHMNRALGLQRAGVLTWSRCQPDPYDEKQREKAQEEIWVFEKDLYPRFISATLHTSSHKFRIPKKVWQGLSTLCMVLVMVWGIRAYVMRGHQAKAPAGEKAQPAALAQAPAGAGVPPAPSGVRPLDLAGYDAQFKARDPERPWTAPAFDDRAVVSDPHLYCMSSGTTSCNCVTEQGTPVRLDLDRCMYRARWGEAYNPFKAPAADQGRSDRLGREERGAGGTPAAEGAPAPAVAVVGIGQPGQSPAPHGTFRAQ